MRQQWNPTYDSGLLPRFMNPQSAVLVGRDVLGPQVVDIREGQPCQRTEAENIPNPLQSFLGIGRFSNRSSSAFVSGILTFDLSIFIL